ncbi:hypothetical protein [Sphingomonas sp.]|uniref:hypothetical protein n=1 Tax=Sphingomonas sp. TaxID=28214 RepID=UPI00286B062B|nr:hypothetical protein [Sphingomonas sp.]
MLTMAMTRAASGLLRALLERTGDQSSRILLSEIQSVDWQSLTFTGETHLLWLRVPGPNADRIVGRLTADLGNAEFAIPGHLVADIAVASAPSCALDGSVTLAIEALTIAD